MRINKNIKSKILQFLIPVKIDIIQFNLPGGVQSQEKKLKIFGITIFHQRIVK